MADVLGISGQMDITDIQKSLDKLCDELARVGVDTDALSQKMTKALNEIVHSDEALSTKTQKAMQLLQSSAEQAVKSMNDVPAAIDAANKRVETIQATIAKLNTELSSTDRGSNQADAITAQIAAQSKSLQLAKADAEDLAKAYNDARVAVSEVSGAAQALSAVSTASAGAGVANSASNAAVSTSAAVATTAISAEAVAHTANAAAANQDTASTTINAHAIENLTAATKEYVQSAYGQDAINKIQGQSSKELANSIKQYKENIKTLNEEIAKRGGDEELQRLSRAIETVKKTIADTQTLAESASGSMADVYQGKLKSLEYTLDTYYAKAIKLENLVSERNSNAAQLEIAQQVQAGQSFTSGEGSVGVDVKGMSLTKLTDQLAESKSKLQELEAEANKYNGQKLTDGQQKELEQLNAKIEDTKGKIASLQAALYEKNKETFVGSLRNKLSDMSQKLSGYGDKIKEKITKPFEELESKISSSSFVQRFSGELQQAKRGLDDMKNGIVNVMTANGKFGQQIDAIGKSFDGLGFPVTKSFKAIKNVTAALWALCTTPIGAAIAAIALAFKAVHTWMTKSKEGQLVYTKLMAYFGSLASSVTDAVVTLGEYLYRCFTKPNGTLKAFGQNFVKTFKTAVTSAVNLVSGLGTTLKGVLDMDWDTFTAGLKQTWNGIKGAGETVLNGFKTGLSGAIGVVATIKDAADDKMLNSGMDDAFGNALEKASKAAKLAGQIQETQIAIKKNSKDQLELEAQIAEQKNKIYTLQGKEKIAAIETTKALVKRKYDTLIEQQKKLAELSKQNAELHTQSLASIAAERELRKDILKTQIQQTSEQRMLTRQEASTERSVASASKRDAKKNAKQDAAVSAAESKLDEVIYKNAYARANAELDLESALTDAKIKAMEEGEEKVIAERNRELKKEIEQIEQKKEAAIKAERDRQKAEFDARQAIVKAQGGKAAQWSDKENLDQKSIDTISAKYTTLEQYAVEASNKQTMAQQIQSMRDYLKEYGTLEEKRLAITKEYDEKINKEPNPYAKASLENERDKALKELDSQSVFDSINWENVFSDLSGHTKKYLEGLKTQLEELLKGGKLTNVADIEKVKNKITDINSALNKQTGIFDFIGTKQQEQIRRLREAKDAQDALNAAKAKEASLTGERGSLMLSANDMAEGLGVKTGMSATELYNNVQNSSVDTSSAQYKEFARTLEKLIVLEGKLAKARKETEDATSKVENAEDATKKSTKQKVADKFSDASQFIQEKGIDKIPDLLNNLGMGDAAEKASQGLSGFNDAKNAASDFASGNYIGALTNGISSLKNFAGAIGIGADNTAKMQDKIDALNQMNSVLADRLSDLNETLQETNSIASANEAYQKSTAIINAQEQNASSAMIAEAEKHGFLANSLNKSVEDNRGWKSAMSQVSQILGVSVSTSKDFLSLSAKQMKEIRDYDPTLLNSILEEYRQEGGHKGRSSSLPSMIEDYINQYADAIDDLNEQMSEKYTQTSFSDLKSNFVSALMDMDKSASDFADDFSTYLMQSVLNAKIGDLLDTELNDFYDEWSKMAADGLSSDEVDYLSDRYNEIVEKGLELRDQAAEISGYADAQSRQSATSKAIEAVTADQASGLIGIGYAMQTAVEQGNEMRSMIQIDVSALRLYAETNANNISEMRDIQYQGLGQLQAINKNTQPILVMSENLENMYKIMKERY